MIDSKEGLGRSLSPSPSWRVVHEIDIVPMVAQHARLRRLCDALERCADHLPDRAAILEATRLSAALADDLSAHTGAEVATLASLFDGVPADESIILIDRIRHRHSVDRLHAEDLHDELTIAAMTMGPVRGELLGYMMRCLFDGCRRGIDFQEAAILMLARERLTKGAMATLRSSLTAAQ